VCIACGICVTDGFLYAEYECKQHRILVCMENNNIKTNDKGRKKEEI
jgi:hypothetical protein